MAKDKRSGSLKALKSSAAVNKALYKFKRPDPSVLERFPNPRSATFGLVVDIVAPEFTSLCPITGQPDFATIRVSYTPGEWCVESKSFKLYLMGFRNFGEFHESCVNRICDDLIALLDPIYLQIVGDFAPRGGISFKPTASYRKNAKPKT